MDTSRLLDTLDAEGRSLATAARQAGTDATVPTCPEWRIADLLRHTGAVHRWAAGFVAEGLKRPRPLDAPPEVDGAELVDWYQDSHRTLVETLRTAAPDIDCWTFLPAPSPLAFWARRQAHETTVHRFDAESALSGPQVPQIPQVPQATHIPSAGPAVPAPSPVAPGFAVDGIDELLRGFHARSRSRVRTDEPRVLRVRATDTRLHTRADADADADTDADTDAVWTVRLSQEPPVTTRGADGPAECELAGPADQLYLALWNRVPIPQVSGDPALAALWRKLSGI
ncbi:maleylpyruvate isomerase family mycothiol-dependent enzyme [Streptomyces sp. NPDC088789]|uniref:maleylpyruvate isomerase family mycothiol-dependent enzyme n=1 Tax=Streptomyces sp. NPDC088789 TaxID=3365899 RepID=UPI003807B6F4